jgi:arsenate reductase (thioredoxin)
MRRADRCWRAALVGAALCSCVHGDARMTSAPAVGSSAAEAPEVVMYPPISRYLDSLTPALADIPEDRKATLDRIAEHVASRGAAGEPAQVIFICTGNSRRSHLAQLWAAVAAQHFGVDEVESYSGGTEPSAFNPRTIAAIVRVGFVVEAPPEAGDNPHYRVRYADGVAAVDAFSKRYDDPSNPHADFVAVMTCSEADRECPFVPGAVLRVSLPYEDPKLADGTPEESARYDERSRQIATEMLYLFSRVAPR